MGHQRMLISAIGCFLLGILAETIQETENWSENRHLHFSNSYYAVLKNERRGNLATSPLGIDELLLMITFGADMHHISFQQLNQSLLLPLQPEEFLRSHEPVTKLLRENPTNVQLQLINRMYVNEKAQILESYQMTLNRFFRAQCNKIDLRNSRLAVKAINNEVASLTWNKIRNVISPKDVNRRTWMILVNVLYFKAKWKTEFEQTLTSSRPFFQNERLWLDVPTMCVYGNFRWFVFPEISATIVELPYENEDFSMIIISPFEDTSVKHVENKLHLPDLWSKLADLKEHALKLYLPKFKIESSLNLKPILEKMGMRHLFSTDADLSRMTLKKGVHVSQIQQKVFLEVNEEGIEAPEISATIVSSTFRGALSELNVNCPFLAILRYKDLNLFMARVSDPRV